MLQRAIDPLSRPFDDEFERLARLHRARQPVSCRFSRWQPLAAVSLHPPFPSLSGKAPVEHSSVAELRQFVRPGSVVYDPFAGPERYGWKRHEARTRGSDFNPVDGSSLQATLQDAVLNALEDIRSHLPRTSGPPPDGSLELERWFSPAVRLRLRRLLLAIDAHTVGESPFFFASAFLRSVACQPDRSDRTRSGDAEPQEAVPFKYPAEIEALLAQERSEASVYEILTKWCSITSSGSSVLAPRPREARRFGHRRMPGRPPGVRMSIWLSHRHPTAALKIPGLRH